MTRALRRPRDRQRGAVDIYRGLVALLMLCALFAIMSWLQSRFDSSDHEKAVEIVRAYVPKDGAVPLAEALLRRHPSRQAHDVAWRSTIVSSCLGHVRVTAVFPAEGPDAEASYAFDVDLTKPSIHPTDPTTVEILKELATLTATSTAGGSS